MSGERSLIEADSSQAHVTRPSGVLARSRLDPHLLRVAVVLIAVYLALRGLGWSATTLFEDHDSAGYLYEARKYLTLNPAEFLNLGPDSNPVFPALSAIFSLPGWGVETGARLVSLLSSIALLVALVLLARRWGSRRATLLGLSCVALSPVLVGLSFAVLSEPVYLAIVYAGLALLWWWYDDPRPWRGAALGGIFGLSFLTRTEGVLFLAFVPAMQLLHHLLQRPHRYSSRVLAAWTGAYVGVFILLAAPQVWNVSRQAGRLLLNGRQIWSVVLNSGPPRSYDERIYGLDYRPDVVNLDYLLLHPEALPRGDDGMDPRKYAKLAMRNFDELYQGVMGRLIGPVGLALFGLGVVSLALTRPRFELLLMAGFFGVTLAGPLMHNVVLRHVAVIAPLIWMVAGVGIEDIAARLGRTPGPWRLRPGLIEACCLAAVALVSVNPLRDVLRPPDCDKYYCAAALAEPVRRLRTFEHQAGRPPRVATRRFYVTAVAPAQPLPLPYAQLPELVRYLELNRADFVFLDEAGAGKFPFYTALAGGGAPEPFELVYRGHDAWRREIALLRVRRTEPAATVGATTR